MGGVATWSVAIFFLLSGMLIGGSIKARVAKGSFSLTEYAVARFWRIYPPLVFSVFIAVACVLIIQFFSLYGAEAYKLDGDLANARKSATIVWSSVLTTLTLTYQLIPEHGYIFFNGSLWSLSFEVWLYVLAGLAVCAVVQRSFAAGALAALLAYQMYHVSVATHPPFWVLSVVWGCGFAYGWATERQRNWLSNKSLYFALLALMTCLIIARADFVWYLRAPYDGTRQHLFYAAFSVLILFFMIRFLHEPNLDHSKVGRLIARSADFSYSLYLLHFPLFLFLTSLLRPYIYPWGLPGAVALTVVSYAIVVMISWASARIVEDRERIRSFFKFKGLARSIQNG